MKTFTALVTLVMLIPATGRAASGDAKAAKVKGVEGNWQGTLRVTPQIELRITLEVIRGNDGSLSGNWGSPDETLKGLPLQTIGVKDSVLTFTTKHGATYEGKLNREETEVVGTWKQRGKSYPLSLGRFDPSKIIMVPIPKELEGIWEGKLKISGGIELRLALKVEKGKDGALKAVLASPDQGAYNIPISSIGLKDYVMTFESKLIGGKYSGKKNPDGTAFEGHFEQNGLKLPLLLKKTDKLSQAIRPQTPKPPFPYRTEEVTYKNASGGVKLAGTLTIPSGAGPFPAVLLLTGSGAQDRDETILGHKPFLILADYLTRRGIAVLRVDDRGVGGSTGSIKSSTSEDFAGDALSGVVFLKGRKEIDSGKIGLIGHSEGGLIAPIAAARLEGRRLHRPHGGDRPAGYRHRRGPGSAHPQGGRGVGVGIEIPANHPEAADRHHRRRERRGGHPAQARRGCERTARRDAGGRAESPGRCRRGALRGRTRPIQQCLVPLLPQYDPRPTLRKSTAPSWRSTARRTCKSPPRRTSRRSTRP